MEAVYLIPYKPCWAISEYAMHLLGYKPIRGPHRLPRHVRACVSHAHMLTYTDTIQFQEPSTSIAFHFWRRHGRVSTSKLGSNQNHGTIDMTNTCVGNLFLINEHLRIGTSSWAHGYGKLHYNIICVST